MTCLLLVAGCNSTKKEIENINELYSALNSFADSMGVDAEIPESNNTQGERSKVYEIDSSFEQFPYEILVNDMESGTNDMTGTMFWFRGYVVDEDYHEDGIDYVSVLVNENTDVIWAVVLLYIPKENDTWEEGLSGEHVFYFEYEAVSEMRLKHFGTYIKHHPLG